MTAALLDRPGASGTSAVEPHLPRWPVAALFAPFAIWWLTGLIDLIIMPLALVMALYLLVSPGVRAPRGFGLWLFFMLLAGISVIELHGGTAVIGFGYRYGIYAASTVLFLYVYNARTTLNGRYVLGLLTILWLTVVLGGYLGLLLPYTTVHTPAGLFVSDNLMKNDLVNHMFNRRFSQANGQAFGLSPRPSAPFRYTNNWGNAYSVLLPLVVTYALSSARRRRNLILGVAVPISAVPALLTLNRGMLLGVGIAVVYTAWRLALMRHYKAILVTGVAAALGAALFFLLPVQERNNERLANANISSTDTRESLYSQALATVPSSPFFGHGSPVEGTDPNAPPVGTHGQIWIFLVSHGPVATGAALGWCALAVWQSRRRRDLVGLGTHVALLVASVELLYYGAVPYGLPVLMVAAGLTLRPLDPVPPEPPGPFPANVGRA